MVRETASMVGEKSIFREFSDLLRRILTISSKESLWMWGNSIL
jgi:hypothetical protein